MVFPVLLICFDRVDSHYLTECRMWLNADLLFHNVFGNYLNVLIKYLLEFSWDVRFPRVPYNESWFVSISEYLSNRHGPFHCMKFPMRFSVYPCSWYNTYTLVVGILLGLLWLV